MMLCIAVRNLMVPPPSSKAGHQVIAMGVQDMSTPTLDF